MMIDEKLKECPFCGGEAGYEDVERFISGNVYKSAGCGTEECMGYQSLASFPTRKQAAKAWNKRANTRKEVSVSDIEAVLVAYIDETIEPTAPNEAAQAVHNLIYKPSKEVSEWLPIESAPRDGTKVQMFYYSEHGHSYGELIVSTFYWLDDIWSSWDSECFCNDEYFIGWQPLPKPPSEEV